MAVEEERGIMMIGMSSAFLQASFPNDDSKEKVMTKLRVVLAGTLDEISPGVCSKHVAYQNNKKTLHASVLKPSNIMLNASTLHWKKLVSGVKETGYVLNLHDSCVPNEIIYNE